MIEPELRPEQALELWDRASVAFHNHPSAPSSCTLYERAHRRPCRCEIWGQLLLTTQATGRSRQVPDKLDHSLTRLENAEDALMKENARLRAALIAAHEALQASGGAARKDRAVQATLRVLDQARKG